MRAVVVERPGNATLTSLPEPVPNRGEVVVRVRCCGICGTDHHLLAEGLPTARYPLVPGHEAWGEVANVGDSGLRLGQFVAIDPSLHCGSCPPCRAGHGNLCDDWGAVGGTKAGAWAELVAVPERNLYVLADDYPVDVAVLIEPVACLLHGIEVLDPAHGATALVMGGGTMGALWALALRTNGLELTAIVELDPARREFCRRALDLPAVAPEELDGIEADYVVDATGQVAAMEEAILRARPGGSVMLFGVAAPEVRIAVSPFLLYQRELRVVSSMAILHTYGAAVGYVARHADMLRPVITDILPLGHFGEALHRLQNGASLKVALDPTLTE